MLKNTEMYAFIHVFRVGSNMAEGWSISHLLFVDDTILLLQCFKVGIRLIILEVFAQLHCQYFIPT